MLVPIADGCEDIETACITDVLARAGVEVVVTSVMPRKEVVMARKLHVVANTLITEENAANYDAIFVPGGMPGAKHLAASDALITMLREMKTKGKFFGAICASPAVVLGARGLLEGVTKVTCYPGMKDKLPQSVEWQPADVVVDGHCITSQGPATAMAFAVACVSMLVSPQKADELARDLLMRK